MPEITKFVVGLTGGIASGKSTVAKYFKELSIDVISADEVARFLMQANTKLVKKIDTLFQEEFNSPKLLDSENELNRSLLREIIFDNPLARRRLDELTHPVISTEIVKRIHTAESDYVVAEIPLLIEANMQELVNRILVVQSASDIQVSRIIHRDKVSKQQAEKILDAQLTNQQRSAYAHDIIDNNGNIDKLKNSVNILHQTYLQIAMIDSQTTGIAFT